MERVALQPVFDVVRHGLVGYAAELDKRTLQRGLLSLIGPGAAAVAGAPGLAEREHAHVAASLAGAERARDPHRRRRRRASARHSRARGVGGAARGRRRRRLARGRAEMARVESGRPRYGVDLDDSVIPQEAGLNERAVSFTKGCYIGQETVARLLLQGQAQPPPARPAPVRARRPPAPRCRSARTTWGRSTSVVDSPRLGPIGLALLRREAEPGAVLVVGDGDASAEVVELPFA